MERFFKLIISIAALVVVGSVAFMGYRVFMGDNGLTMPLLTQRTVTDAMSELERVGLRGRIETERSTVPQGTVLAQTPKPGMKVRSDTIVTLKVSGGTTRLQLPDLRGLLVDEAVSQISQTGFRVGDQIHISSDKPAGTVIAQEPAAPGSVAMTQAINLMVSTGSGKGDGISVPDLVQRSYEEAVTLLQSSGLKAGRQEEYAPNTPAGMVLSMSPRAGSSVPAGSRVTLTVASHDQSLAPQVGEVTPAAGAAQEAPAQSAAPQEESSAGQQSQTTAPVVEVAPQRQQVPAGVPTFEIKPKTEAQSEPAPQAQTQQVPAAGGATKVAPIRYQVPPVEGMKVRVEMADATGNKVLLDRVAQSGELLRLDAPYQGTASVTIYLGGEFVWQDRYN